MNFAIKCLLACSDVTALWLGTYDCTKHVPDRRLWMGARCPQIRPRTQGLTLPPIFAAHVDAPGEVVDSAVPPPGAAFWPQEVFSAASAA